MFFSCVRCEDPEDFGLEGNSVLCLQCGTGHVVQGKDDRGIDAAGWSCKSCNQSVSEEKVLQLSFKYNVALLIGPRNLSALNVYKNYLLNYGLNVKISQIRPSRILLILSEDFVSLGRDNKDCSLGKQYELMLYLCLKSRIQFISNPNGM